MLEPLVGPNWEGVRYGFFGRAGGVSSGDYGSLNCGLGSRDERALVLENRDRVARHLGSRGDRLLTGYQVHSAVAVAVEGPWGDPGPAQADGLVTRTRGLVLGALAADCTPILFAEPAAGVVGAAHAGWKGALAGIGRATVDAMVGLGASRHGIHAIVGPCISQANYEVGPEFEAAFLARDAASARYFSIPPGATRAHFDLPRFVFDGLSTLGLASVSNLSVCTYANPDRYFSFRRATHRRDADYGRQISAIVLA